MDGTGIRDSTPGNSFSFNSTFQFPTNDIQPTATPHVLRNEVIIPSIENTTSYPSLTQSREALGIDSSVDILHHIRELPTTEDQAAAVAKVQAVERKAMLDQQPQPGLARLMDYLKSRSLRRGLCTRNFEYAFPLDLRFPVT